LFEYSFAEKTPISRRNAIKTDDKKGGDLLIEVYKNYFPHFLVN